MGGYQRCLFTGPCDGLRLQATSHSGETDEANCSWLHPVWPPPKRPDQDSTFCVVSRASTALTFCIHRYYDVRNNVYKPRRLVCQCLRDISAWKSRVMKPTVLGDEANFEGAFAWMKPTEYGWSQLHICDELRSIVFDCLLSLKFAFFISGVSQDRD